MYFPSSVSENISDQLIALVNKESSLVGPLVTLMKSLLPAVEAACQRNSPVGCHLRTKTALQELHVKPKKFVFSDQIMVTLILCLYSYKVNFYCRWFMVIPFVYCVPLIYCKAFDISEGEKA